MAIPRVGKRGVEAETVNLEKTGVDNRDNIEKLTISEDMEKILIQIYKQAEQNQLFLKTNKFLLFRI